MDIIHHSVIGGIGFIGLTAQQHELAALGFLAGSVAPDLDVALIAFGKRSYLRNHQGPSHSLPFAGLYAALLTALALPVAGWNWSLYGGLLAGICIHVLLDLSNTFGIQILWPLTQRRFCLDAVFFIDGIAWTLTLGFFALAISAILPPVMMATGYGTLLSAYIGAKLLLQRRVKRHMGVEFAIPSALNPFVFLLYSKRNGKLETATYNAVSEHTSAQAAIPEAAPAITALAAKSRVFRDMQGILRNLQITRTSTDANGTLIIAQDLAVRNFGGQFGRTELHFDNAGNLLNEMAHI